MVVAVALSVGVAVMTVFTYVAVAGKMANTAAALVLKAVEVENSSILGLYRDPGKDTVTVTLINTPPPELVLRFGLMEGGGGS